MAWLPLESNPDVMNKFLGTLGVPAKWQIVDVYGLEPDLLAMVPRPVVAVILLFPTSDKYEEHRSQQEAEIKEKGQTVSDKVYYLKQYVQNACGTIALIHSIANNTEMVQLCDGHLKQFLDDSGNLSPEEHGELLQKAEGIINVHKDIGREGQTEAPEPSEPVNYHFVAFVCKDGDLYELDGRKSFPVNHGTTSPDTLLEWRQFLKKIEERLRTMIASKEFMKSFIQGKSNSHCPNIAGNKESNYDHKMD